MSTKIQLRRGTATQWTTANPVLAAGEVGYETDTGNIKVGTGTAGSGAWNNLPYYQLPRVSVDPATSSNLNAANYLVQGIYRLATNSNSGVTWTGTPTDFHSATTAESTLTVTIHQYTGQTTLTQQVLTQRTTTTGSVKQWVRLWDGTTLTAWSSTSHLSDNEVTTAKIADATSTTDGVTNSKLRWSAASSVIGRSAATNGAPADIVAGTDGHVLRRAADDTIGFGTLLPAAFDANTDMPLTSLAAQAALSVVANSTNASAVPTAVTATAASGAVLRESGNALGFGTVATAGIADGAILTAKIADSSSTSTGVTNAKIRQSGALSVIGRSANSTGSPADIQATAGSGAVLRESGNAIGFGTIATAGIADNAITAAKINLSSVQTNYTSTTSYTQSVPTAATAAAALASMVEMTALSTTITPSTTASKVFVNFNICGESNLGDGTGGYASGFVLTRTIGTTETNLGLANAGGSQQCRFTKPVMYDSDNDSTMQCYSIQFLDSPNTTSPCTYAVHFYGYAGDVRQWTFYLNRTVTNANDSRFELGSSQAILIEMY